MSYNRFNKFYLLRTIYANGNEYKTIDEIFNSLDPKIDRPEFDLLFIELKRLMFLDEHNLTHKFKVNSIGETYLINIDRQEESERLRLADQTPVKKPVSQTIKKIKTKYLYPFGKWIIDHIAQIIVATIATILAAVIIAKYKLPH